MRYILLGTIDEQWAALWQASTEACHDPVRAVALAERGFRSPVSVFPAGVDLVQPFQVAWCNRASGSIQAPGPRTVLGTRRPPGQQACAALPRLAARQPAEAVAGSTPEAHAAVEQHGRLWLSVRDACPVGREHRYSDDQIGYHYTKDRDR